MGSLPVPSDAKPRESIRSGQRPFCFLQDRSSIRLKAINYAPGSRTRRRGERHTPQQYRFLNGDSERFDFILISRGWPEGDKLWRVQVKSTATLKDGFYHANAHRRARDRVIPCKPTEIDFLVVYIIPEDAWFIFPVAVLSGRTSLSFKPKNSRRPGAFEPHRDAWHLLRPPE